MKKIELHGANRMHSHGNVYQKGVEYTVSNQLFDELMALKNPRNLPYFRVPLTAAQKKEAAERAARLIRGDTSGVSQMSAGRNVVKVEPEGEAPEPVIVKSAAAPAEAAAEVPELDEDDGEGVSV